MITTTKSIIKRSLRIISATASGEEPTPDEYSDCLDVLSTMAEAWDIEKLMSSASGTTSVSVSQGVSSLTIGPSGTLVAGQIPTFLDYVYASNNSVNYEVIIPSSRKEFDDEVSNNPSGWPQLAYYTKHDPNSTESVLEFSCPMPESTTVTLGIPGRGPLFSGLDAQINLPAGLKRAIEYNLAIEVAPEFQAQPSPLVVRIAAESKASFKLHNITIEKLQTPSEYSYANNSNATFDYRNG